MSFHTVVILNDFGFVNGGASQVAIASAKGLTSQGVSVRYFCAVGPVDEELVAAGVDVTCLGQSDILSNPSRASAAISGIWNAEAASGLRRLLVELDPKTTVVHMHGWSKALSPSVLSALEKSGFPVVVTLHEFFLACPNGGFFDYQSQRNCGRRALGWSCVSTNCDPRSYAQKLWRVGRQAVARGFAGVPSGVSEVIYLSNLSREVLAPYFPPATHWNFLRNPIEIEKPARATAEANLEFIYVGRLSREKGAELLAEAAHELGVPCRIIGDGELRPTIESSFPTVAMTGWLDAVGVQAAVRQARCLVFPARWYETFGLTAYEALAQGVPVIVADGCAARDAVEDGINGLWFIQSDSASLQNAMSKCLDSDQVKKMSVSAYERYWSDPPTLKAHCDGLVRIYDGARRRHRALR